MSRRSAYRPALPAWVTYYDRRRRRARRRCPRCGRAGTHSNAVCRETVRGRRRPLPRYLPAVLTFLLLLLTGLSLRSS